MTEILFVDHVYHLRTWSTVFMVELLRELGTVHEHWIDGKGWTRDDVALVDELAPRIVFVCQPMPPPGVWRHWDRKTRVVLAPMWDEAQHRSRAWFPHAGLYFSFCEALHRRLTSWGLDSRRVQYFPSVPDTLPPPGDELALSWWRRRPEVSWPVVDALLGAFPIRRLYYRDAPDPDVPLSPVPERVRARVDVVELGWFTERAEYLRAVAPAQLHMAPRLSEGIGLSFLEPLAMGRVVVAPNLPTMNEYLRPTCALLYDWRRPAFASADVDYLARGAGELAGVWREAWARDRAASLLALRALL